MRGDFLSDYGRRSSISGRGGLFRSRFLENTSLAFLEAIRGEACEDMFSNAQGIMMGDGNVWISEILDENLASRRSKVYGMNGLGGE